MSDRDGWLGPREIAYANAVARRFFREPQDAADAAQDALVAAFRHRAGFRHDARLLTWLHRIVVNTSLGHLRKRARGPVLVPLDAQAAPELPCPARSPEAQVGDAEQAAAARAALRALGAKYDAVFRLRFEEDAAEAEVAAALHLTVATVKIRTHRARHALRAALARAA